jgi:NADPH:quinone reductase-like Zn-dependent oxidoreductase
MKAIVQDRYGPPDVLELKDINKPVVNDGEVLARVHAASVHPDVWHVLRGLPYVLRIMGAGLSKPKNSVPGTDVAGHVESVGKDVTLFQPGDEVFGESVRGHQWHNGGAYAEYVSIPENALALKPANITFEQAAAVPTSGLIDYTQEDFTQSGKRYHLIVDIPGNYSFSECRRALTPRGTYVLIGHDHFGKQGDRFLGGLPRGLKQIAMSPFVSQLPDLSFSMPSKRDSMAVLKELLEAGKITPVIDRTYPLSEVPEAIRYLQEGQARGKVVITV